MKLSAAQMRAVAMQTVEAINTAKLEFLREKFKTILKDETAELKRLKKERDLLDEKIENLISSAERKFPYINSYSRKLEFNERLQSESDKISDINNLYTKMVIDSIKAEEFDAKRFMEDAVKTALAELKKAY